MAKKSKVELELAKLKKKAAAAKKKIKAEVRSAPPSRSVWDGTLRSLTRRNELASYGGSTYADVMKDAARKMPEGTLPFVNEEKVKLSIRKGPSAEQKAEANRIKDSDKKTGSFLKAIVAKKAAKKAKLTQAWYDKREAQAKAIAEDKSRRARVVKAPGKTTGKKASSGPYKGLTLSQRMGAEGAKVKRRIARERKSSTLSSLIDKYAGPRRLKGALGIGQPKTSTPVLERDELVKASRPTAKKAKASATVKAQASAPARAKRRSLRDVLVKPSAKAAPAKAAKLKSGGLIGTMRRVAGMTKPTAKAAAKPQAKAQSKGAPNLPKNWRSLPTSHPDRVAFRSWYKKNRPSAPKTAVAKAVATKKAAPKTAAPARTADLTGLQKRIEMKRKSGQDIPASWLKAEKVAKAKARVAKVTQASKRIPSSIDRLENEKEAARGRREMAARKANVAADADRRANKGYAKEVAQGKAATRKAEATGVALEAQRGKREAFERTQRLKGDVKRRAAAKSEKQREDRLVAEQSAHDASKRKQANLKTFPEHR